MSAIFPLKPKNGFYYKRDPHLLYCPQCGHYTASHVGQTFLKDTRVIIIPKGVDWEMDVLAEYPLNDPVQISPDIKVMWIPEPPEFPTLHAITCNVCPECHEIFYYIKYSNDKYISDTDLFRLFKWKALYEQETAPF